MRIPGFELSNEEFQLSKRRAAPTEKAGHFVSLKYVYGA